MPKENDNELLDLQTLLSRFNVKYHFVKKSVLVAVLKYPRLIDSFSP